MDKVQKINKDYYDTHAEKWAAVKTHSFYSEQQFRVFVRYLKAGARVLDVGCGYGREVPLFLGIGRKLRYEGFDISKKILAIAQSRYPQLKFYRGNLLEHKTLPRKKYDAFWAAASFQHIQKEQWPTMLENIEAVANKKAVVYFSVPDDRPNLASAEDPRHFSLFTDKEIKKILEARHWRVLAEGELPATRGTAIWRWYIARLP